MAAKATTKSSGFRCSECGWTTVKWVGRCGECQSWGSVSEIGAVTVRTTAAIGLSALAATLVTGITVLATAASLSPRPQLVGFALLAVTASAWVRVLSDHRAPWWLVPVPTRKRRTASTRARSSSCS